MYGGHCRTISVVLPRELTPLIGREFQDELMNAWVSSWHWGVKCPLKINLHSSCQIRWQFVICILSLFASPIPLACSPTKKSSRENISIYTREERAEQKGLHDHMGLTPRFGSERSVMPPFSQKSSKMLSKGTPRLLASKKKETKRDNTKLMVYKAILSGNTRDS